MGYEREEDYKEMDVEKLHIVEAAQKRYISVAEGRMLYSLGVHTFEKTCKGFWRKASDRRRSSCKCPGFE